MPRKSVNNDNRIQERLDLYRRDYDIEALNESNDKALLMTLIRSEIILENVQNEIQNITSVGDDFLEEADRLKKLFDLQRDMMQQITKAQQALSIDRRTRKSEQSNSVADYIRVIKREAFNFLDKRLIKVYCPDCKVMVGRYAPVHDHTAFIVSTECSQCSKAVRAHREARDIWFDVKDADWRREYKAEIVQPTLRSGFNASIIDTLADDEVTIDALHIGQPEIDEEPWLDVPEVPAIEMDRILEDTHGTDSEA